MLTPWHVVEYMTQQPLQFDPGAKSVYSNFGNCLLRRVLEVIYDRTYFECVDAMIRKPLGTKQIQAAHSSSNRRPQEEVWYPISDNVFAIETMDGLIASAPALCQFFDNYWSSGEPREESQQFDYWASGSLPGTTAVVKQTADGWNVVVLMNNRRNSNYARDISRLVKDIERAIEPLK
jgi:CubicO group peptidase (beta-lactamase class C family)